MSLESAQAKAETTGWLIPDVEISCGSERWRRAPPTSAVLARCPAVGIVFCRGDQPCGEGFRPVAGSSVFRHAAARSGLPRAS
jgi:hypothetical protein